MISIKLNPLSYKSTTYISRGKRPSFFNYTSKAALTLLIISIEPDSSIDYEEGPILPAGHARAHPPGSIGPSFYFSI